MKKPVDFGLIVTILVFILIATATSFLLLYRYNDSLECEAAGGQYLKSFTGYECVYAAKK